MNKRYINREISWLRFNGRVLQEAINEKVPLLERLRFLGIYSNNLDEFYAVRYSAILRSIQFKDDFRTYNNIVESQSDEQLLEEINAIVLEQRIVYDELYHKLLEELKSHKIFIVDDKTIPGAYHQYMDDYFYSGFQAYVGIYNINEKLDLPQLRDGAFYMAVKMTVADESKYALVDVPTDSFPRFIKLPKIDDNQYVIYIEDIIRYHLSNFFRIFNYDKIEAHSIKVTRDAELDMDNDLEHTLLEKITQSLKNRKTGEPVRIVYDREIADDTLNFLLDKLHFDEFDSVIPGGRYHNKRDLMRFPTMGDSTMVYETIKQINLQSPENYSNYFEAVSKRDFLIYVPYNDYALFLRFLRQAAIDPLVTRICITIYRVSKDSQIMSSLINAARNGKEVTAVMELQARFDEENNVRWSQKLQEAGGKIVFGVPGLKVHAKVGLIERLPDGDRATAYAFFSTGNFHAGTAKIYTDYTLLTANQELTREVQQLFKFFDANYLVYSYNHLLVSPLYTRKRLAKFIKKEIKNKRKGLPAQINFKLNSLTDKEIIDLLYEASKEGVEVRLVVRGIHCLIPQVAGLSENIRSVSVVDKFLEHPRVYWFKNGGDDKVFISSADMMERNLDKRVEVACPIYDIRLKKVVMDTFDLSFTDNVKARYHDDDLGNVYVINDLPENRSQLTTYEYLKKLNETNGY